MVPAEESTILWFQLGTNFSGSKPVYLWWKCAEPFKQGPKLEQNPIHIGGNDLCERTPQSYGGLKGGVTVREAPQ